MLVSALALAYRASNEETMMEKARRKQTREDVSTSKLSEMFLNWCGINLEATFCSGKSNGPDSTGTLQDSVAGSEGSCLGDLRQGSLLHSEHASSSFKCRDNSYLQDCLRNWDSVCESTYFTTQYIV